ncbi:hypothetical protein [Microbacterium sp. A93]|uniref:hypothetical protein n=1 Tax=Microbacterium sp. A93 TaxID=3450716 RepID=UPI003F426A51
MTVVQQILYTEHPADWWKLAETLGFVAPFPPDAAWGEFHADGVLGIHGVEDEHGVTAAHRPGTTDIHLIVEDLDAAASALSGFDVEAVTMEGVGEMVIVRAASGVSISVSEGAVQRGAGDIAVQPTWFQEDLTEPRGILEALGFRAGIVADRGGWVEMLCDGGVVGLHEGEPRIGLSFEARGDLDALAVRLRDAGFAASVVDEAFARTVRISDPDGGDEVWINAVQEDLHGYHR